MIAKRFVALALAATITVCSASVSFADSSAPAEEPGGGAVTAAVFSNVVYVPGKAGVLCCQWRTLGRDHGTYRWGILQGGWWPR